MVLLCPPGEKHWAAMDLPYRSEITGCCEKGPDGMIVRRGLRVEMMWLETDFPMAMASIIYDEIHRAGNLKAIVFGGDGLFLATVRGHGTVGLQSLSFARTADRIHPGAPSAGEASRG